MLGNRNLLCLIDLVVICADLLIRNALKEGKKQKKDKIS